MKLAESRGEREERRVVSEDKHVLLDEIRQAYIQWAAARERLNWVMGQEETDYAIFALAAAEKKYGMLLRQAKRLDWERSYLFWSSGGYAT
jgi:hypothetical protein